MMAHPLGLVSISFRGHSPEEIVMAAKEAGLSCIEWGSDVHAPCREKERLLRLAALQKEIGIVASSYGTYFRLGETPLSELPFYIEAAKILGTDILRLWCGSKSGADMKEEEKEALFAACREAAQVAEREGVVLCTECHRATFTERVEDTLSLMKAVNSPSFKTYFQPFQFQSEEYNVFMAEALAPYVKCVHVFNWQGSERYPLKEGSAAWRRYLSAIGRPIPLLLEFMPDDRLETLSQEAQALREIIGETV